MDKIFSNQATSQYLGYVYQVLVAIELYFDSEANQTIWLECYGDIYDGSVITETKNHLKPNNLTNNSIDFWKTLYNFLKEHTDSTQYFILHTTSNIPSYSIFHNWNSKSVEQKYNILKSHSPTKTIKNYYNYIFSDDLKSKLKMILEKFSIKSSQESIENKWASLKENQHIRHFGKHTEDALSWLYGQFNHQAIIEYRQWHISVNEMNNKLTIFSNIFNRKKISFPFISKKEVPFDIKKCKFPFIDELTKIELKTMAITTAVSDYLRSQNSHIKLINEYADTLTKILENHDESILDRLISKKQEHADNITGEHINKGEFSSFSRQLYHNCISSIETIEIPMINNTERYYQNGRIHHNVNEENFSWIFNEEDIS
jgi:hypothetical protein